MTNQSQYRVRLQLCNNWSDYTNYLLEILIAPADHRHFKRLLFTEVKTEYLLSSLTLLQQRNSCTLHFRLNLQLFFFFNIQFCFY